MCINFARCHFVHRRTALEHPTHRLPQKLLLVGLFWRLDNDELFCQRWADELVVRAFHDLVCMCVRVLNSLESRSAAEDATENDIPALLAGVRSATRTAPWKVCSFLSFYHGAGEWFMISWQRICFHNREFACWLDPRWDQFWWPSSWPPDSAVQIFSAIEILYDGQQNMSDHNTVMRCGCLS